MPDPRGDGYVDEIPYTHGYHAAMNPRLMQWTVARAGFQPPEVHSACELGFGRGVSLAIHGSVGTARWQGTDFNPEHSRSALALCEGCEPQPKIYADSFAEYFARPDLPNFDFIALHAVWSWISPENRARLVAFIRQRLRPGGALYLSYNALPGWQPMLALREQLVDRAEAARQGGLPISAAIRQAIVELERLAPEHDVVLHSLKRRSVSYLAHEFFNRDWHPMTPDAVADELAAAGVQRICPAEKQPSASFRSEYWLRDATALDWRRSRRCCLALRFTTGAASRRSRSCCRRAGPVPLKVLPRRWCRSAMHGKSTGSCLRSRSAAPNPRCSPVRLPAEALSSVG